MNAYEAERRDVSQGSKQRRRSLKTVETRRIIHKESHTNTIFTSGSMELVNPGDSIGGSRSKTGHEATSERSDGE